MTDIPAPVRAVVDAINAGDTDAFVAAFTTDGRVDDWGRVLTGPDGIRSWAHSDAIGAGAAMSVLAATTTNDVTEVRFDWRSAKFNGQSTAFVTVRGELVSEFRIPPVH